LYSILTNWFGAKGVGVMASLRQGGLFCQSHLLAVHRARE
jgi:hypothetical protein